MLENRAPLGRSAMLVPQHVCVLYLATAGLQGPAMGSDEEEVVLLIYVLIDVQQNKVNLSMLKHGTLKKNKK